jgi:hypothetical protein
MIDSKNEIKKTSPLTIVLAWLVVGIPAGWGVYNTGLNAVKLFTPPQAEVVAPSKASENVQTKEPAIAEPAKGSK